MENGKTQDENTSLNVKSVDPGQMVRTKVHKRRWWVMGVFCFLGILQSMVWNTWGPISESSEIVLGWSDGNIAVVTNLGVISFMIVVIPTSMMLDTKGLRFAMLFSAGLLLVCTGMRCFTLDIDVFMPIAYVSAFIQGVAGTIPDAGPALIAALWFPPKQRPTATAIASFFNSLGTSLSFIIGPRIVPDPVYNIIDINPLNKSKTDSEDIFLKDTSILYKSGSLVNVTNREEMESGIRYLMYTHAGLSALVVFLVLLYFPSKPPCPPSVTATIQRTSYKKALSQLLRNRQLWLIVFAASISTGVVGTWIAIFDIVAKPLGVSQIHAGWIGFWHTQVGCFSGILLAKFSGLFGRHRKYLIIISFIGAAACSVWVALLCDRIIDFKTVWLYVSCIALGILVNGTVPIFFEMCAETSFPVAEGVTGGFYTLTNNLITSSFLVLVSVQIGTSWMTWAVLGALVLAVPLLVIFREQNKRTDIDDGLLQKD